MLAIYLYDDGTAETEKLPIARYQEHLVDLYRNNNQAVVVLTVDEYNGETKVLRNRTRTADDERNETFDLADRAVVATENERFKSYGLTDAEIKLIETNRDRQATVEDDPA